MKVITICRHTVSCALAVLGLFHAVGFSQSVEYKLLATTRTSTMEKELNQAAGVGFRFEAAMGGETGFGGKETVAIMSRPIGKDAAPAYEYRLLATNRTSTMQKELQLAGDIGFVYKAQTVFRTAFGGNEVVIILERDRNTPLRRYEYKLLATLKTSTMDKELQEAGSAGYDFAGMSVGETAVGGHEVVCILKRLKGNQ
jgi:hypothetical protein